MQREMAEATNTDNRDALVRLGIGEAQAAPHGVSGAEDGRGLLIAECGGNGHSRIGICEHVFGMAALHRDAGRSGVHTQLFLAAQTPLALAITFLHPAHAHAVSHFAGSHARTNFHDLAHRFMTQHAREWQGEQAVSKMHVGIAKPAGVDLHHDLIRTCLGGFPLLDFPFAVYGGDDCSFHDEDSG